jgi:hypothetical protein
MPRAQSADGVFHEFPDGTSPAVIDRVMKQYAQPAATPAETSDHPSPLSSYLRASLESLKGAGKDIAAGAKDIGQALVPGMDPRPGFKRTGDIAQFLTGGLTSPLGTEARGVDAGAKIAASGEARNLARELKAPEKIEKAEQQAAKPPSSSLSLNPFDLASVGGVMEMVTHGNWKGLGVALGSKTAEQVMKWARDPGRRMEDLQKFLDARRQARVADMRRFVDEHGGAALADLQKLVEQHRQSAQPARSP